jgi:RNA-binding protein 39
LFSGRSDRDKERDKEREKENERRRREEERERERSRERKLDPKEREAIERERDERTIFAMNLPLKADEDDVKKFFSVAGKVRDVRLITDRNSRKSKG